MFYSNNHYYKKFKFLARKLRKDPIRAESALWHQALNQRKMMDYRFLRQRVIDQYIVDFFCKDLKLIIEVDGYTHQFEEVFERDKLRENKLNSLGYYVLRFEDDEVLNDINNVVRTIENWILNVEMS